MAERSLGSLVYWIRAKNEEFKQKARESGQALQDMNEKFEESKKTVKSWSEQVKSGLQQVTDFAKKNKEAIQTMAVGAGAALAALTLEIKKATKENVEYKNSLIGLSSIAKSLKVDVNQATQAAKELSADGLMSISDAAAGLKNLLQAGFGLDEAVILMERFKDSAAFGRQGALSFGEAVVSATEGVKNGNSVLVDNAGVTKNLSVMLQEAGYSAQDLGRAADDAGVRMAIFNGIIRETRHQVGDAAKLAAELGGALSRTEESTRKVHRAIGAAVEGPLREMLNIIQPILERTADWIERNKELVGAIITITTAVTALTAGGAAWLLLIPKISSALNLLAQGPVGWTILGLTTLVTAFVAVKNAMQKAREEQERFIERKKEMADKIGYEARELHTLLDEYDRLTTKSNLSKEEHERLNEVVAEIGEIVPEAVTQWDSLGNAIEINADKARDAVKDMLEARKALLEIATARAEAQKPILEATIEREEARVRKAEERFREAKENVNKAIRLQAEAKKLYDRLLAGEDVETIYQDALAAGIVAFEGAPLPGALEFWLKQGIQSAEEELVKAAQNLDKVGQKYYDAKEKLAQLAGDEAELRAIIARMEEGDLYAGLDKDGKKPSEVDAGDAGVVLFDVDKFLDQLRKELENIDKVAEVFGDTSDVAANKASTLRKAIIELVENGVDPTNTAMGNLVEQYKEHSQAAEDAKKETYNLSEAESELKEALANIDKQAAVFGDTIDADAEKLKLYQDAITAALVNDEPVENLQKLIAEYTTLKDKIDEATKAKQNNEAATALLGQAQEYLYRMTGKLAPEWERFAQKLEEMAGKEGVLPETAAQLREIADQIRGVGAEMEPERNWFTDMFEEIGYKIEEAHDIFQSFRDGLIDGFTEIITKGKSVGDVFKQILDYLAKMIIMKGIVEPLIEGIFDEIGLGGGGGSGGSGGSGESAHFGALVTPAGLVHDLPDYHGGGVIPGLRSDERVIKVLTGERILSREQNKKFEAGEYGKTEVMNVFNINAVDAASFVQLVRRHPEAITSVVAGDIAQNGQLRQVIKRYTK